MPDPRHPVRSSKPTTPENFPVPSPSPSDYSYTVEIVMNMQTSMGRLLEAVETLKSTSRDQVEKMGALAQEVHGYKVGFAWIKGLLWTIAALLGFAITTYIAYHKS